MLNYQNDAKLLFWQMHSKLALRVTIQKVPANITVSTNLWDKITFSKNISWLGDKDLYQGIGANILNMELMQMKMDVQQVCTLLLGHGCEMTSKAVADVYRLMVKRQHPFNFEGLEKCLIELGMSKSRSTLLDCLNWLISYKSDVELLEEGTIETYETRIKNFQDFLKEKKNEKFLAENFTPAVATQFCDWMLKRGVSKNHIARHIITVKEALKQSAIREYIPLNPLVEFVFSREESEDLRHLEWDQLTALEVLDLSMSPKRLRQTRDMFVLSCYTGLHYCDRVGLSSDNLRIIEGNYWIFKTRQKTKRFGAQAMVKLHPKAVEIIERYNGLDNLPSLGNSETNYDLKLLQRMIGIDIGLSTKIARKTFTHLCLNHWLIDVDTSSAMMGLKDSRHIKKYGKINEKRINKLVNW